MNSTIPSVATDKFVAGYNCAQAVLYSATERTGLDPDTALRIACGFGAGLGRAQEVCGAVTGGIMAIGLKYGRGEGEEKSKTDECYQRTREFLAHFEERHGSIHCRELIQCDLLTPEGQAAFKERRLHSEVCSKCVHTAAAWVSSHQN